MPASCRAIGSQTGQVGVRPGGRVTGRRMQRYNGPACRIGRLVRNACPNKGVPTMNKHEIAATVLLAATKAPEVDLKDHCDIYTSTADGAIALLQEHANVTQKSLGVPATSKFGARIASPLGAVLQAKRVTVKINEAGRSFVEGKTKEQLITALKEITPE